MSGLLPQHRTSSIDQSITWLTDALIAASSLRRGDKVVVIGRGALGHLLALARTTCKSAAAFSSPLACRSDQATADIVWFTGIDASDTTIDATIDHLDTPRVVAVELHHPDDLHGGATAIVARLRAKGFIDHTLIVSAGRPVLVAVRPVWLRRVI